MSKLPVVCGLDVLLIAVSSDEIKLSASTLVGGTWKKKNEVLHYLYLQNMNMYRKKKHHKKQSSQI